MEAREQPRYCEKNTIASERGSCRFLIRASWFLYYEKTRFHHFGDWNRLLHFCRNRIRGFSGRDLCTNRRSGTDYDVIGRLRTHWAGGPGAEYAGRSSQEIGSILDSDFCLLNSCSRFPACCRLPQVKGGDPRS
jgi:hypothetical protein